jgi:hypothetical protein
VPSYKQADYLLLRMEAWLVIDHLAARLVERCQQTRTVNGSRKSERLAVEKFSAGWLRVL